VTVDGADHLEAFRLDHGAEHRAIIIDEQDPGFVHGGGVQRPAGAGAPAGPMCCAIKRARSAKSRSWSRRATATGLVYGGALARFQLGAAAIGLVSTILALQDDEEGVHSKREIRR